MNPTERTVPVVGTDPEPIVSYCLTCFPHAVYCLAKWMITSAVRMAKVMERPHPRISAGDMGSDARTVSSGCVVGESCPVREFGGSCVW